VTVTVDPRFIGVVTTALVVGACQPTNISFPVTGRLSDGRILIGEATARSDGTGRFQVRAPGTFRCEGGYDPFAASASMVIPFACSDGRRGEAVVAIGMDRSSAWGHVRLDNGVTGHVVIGDITFAQAFGSMSRTESRRP
jgi:hypothetical protein